MSTSKKILIGAAAVIVLVFIYGLTTYNSLVSKKEAIDNQWAQVQTQYQRRFDLIPNVVSSVQGVMKQEQKVFGDIAQARSHYAGASSVDDKINAANEVESSLSRLLVIMENYPQLKSSENVQSLITELEGTENRISVERKRFNDMVQAYNLAIKKFPSSIIASMFNFTEKSYFQAASGTETAPKVQL